MTEKRGVIEYRQEKMAGNLEKVGKMKVCIIGVGAVGSLIAETCYQHGVGVVSGNLVLNDFDTIDASNYTKQSGIYKGSDCGRPKVIALSERINELVGRPDYCIPYNMDCSRLGPEFFSKFDVVFVAVDNFKARLHINKMVKMASSTPWLITTGTGTNNAESICLDMKTICARDLWAEKWIEREKRNTSCRFAYEAQVRAGHTPTSKMLSAYAALNAFAQFLALTEGSDSVLNARKEIMMSDDGVVMNTSRPLPKKNCPDCQLSAPKELEKLRGSVCTMTARELLHAIEECLGTDKFEVCLDTFVVEDYCPGCLKKKKVYRPAKYLKQEELYCEECKGNGYKEDIPTPLTVNKISYDTEERILDMTLFELGYELYGHINVNSQVSSILENDSCGWVFTLDEK